ncbi:MAG TPA: MBG domain-containing protein [Clostridia bacterium]|nr:MBG domain-containing protein [Clostridia bacterium]
MAGRKVKKLILFTALAAISVCLFALSTFFALDGQKSFSRIYAQTPPSSASLDEYYSRVDGIVSELGIGEWGFYTPYPESYRLTETAYGGENCLYFGRYAADTSYSMEGQLTSPQIYLNPSHETYSLSFDHFSPRTRDLANRIAVFVSADGVKFEKAGEVSRVYDSNLGEFSSAAFDIPSNTKYIRFDLKVYHSNDLDEGIYLRNFNLLPKTPVGGTAPGFIIEFDTTTLAYTGHRLIPSYTVTCSDPDYEYGVEEVVLNSAYKLSESVNLGSYTLVLLVHGADNEIVQITERPFTIGKGTIAKAEVDYIATTEAIYINHVALYNADGDKINAQAGLISYTEPSSSPYTTRVTVQESAYYNAFVSDYITLPVNSEYRFSTGNPERIFEYDGAGKTLVFDNFSGLDSTVKYYRYGRLLSSPPVDAGEYTAEIYIEDTLVKTLSMVITPLEITSIALKAGVTMEGKAYDGTTYAYEYDTSDFVFSTSGGIVDDDSLKLENLHFAGTVGTTYFVFDKASFGPNYVLKSGASVEKIYVGIDPIAIKLTENTDTQNRTILTISDKQYDGTDTASINFSDIASRYGSADKAPLQFMGVPKDDVLLLDSISAAFDDIYAGENVPVSLTITDQTCFDRFIPEIWTPKGLVSGRIVPKTLDVDTASSDLDVVTKKYDATLKADVIINSAVFSSGIIAGDASVFADSGNFELVYESAQFADPNAGIKQVNVRNISLRSKNPAYSKIIASYEVNDITLSGEIEKATVTVNDSYFHLISGQPVPAIRTTPSDVMLYTSFHHTREAAEAGTGEIVDFDTNSYLGIFYIRTEAAFSETNYEIEGGFAIITLQITGAKKAQTLDFNIPSAFEHTDGEGVYYVMAIGGRYSPKAFSYATIGATNHNTGLPITYERNTGTRMTYSQGVFTAREEGWVTITIVQNGNDNYLAAESVTIRIQIVSAEIVPDDDVAAAEALYYGNPVPEITGSALFGGENVAGNYIKRAGTLSAGKANYLYNFAPTEKYLGEYSDIPVELDAQKAVLKVVIGDIFKEYYTEVNFFDYAEITLEKGGFERKLTVEEFEALGITITLHSSQPVHEWLAAFLPYTVGYDNSYSNYVEFSGNSNYEIVVEDDIFQIYVTPAIISVVVVDFSREYGNGDYIIEYQIFGNFRPDDAPAIIDSVVLTEQSRLRSGTGRYAVLLTPGTTDPSLNNKYQIYTRSGFVDILKAQVTITAESLTSVYGESVIAPAYTAEGFHINEDREYYERYITATHDVTSQSNVGTYTIRVNCLADNDNYEFVFNNGTYTVTPATLTGITLPNVNFIYDGKPHSLSIVYNPNVWGELNVSYSDTDIVNVGRYPITAIVSKPNYHNLELNAILTVSPLSISTSGTASSAIITMKGENPQGFDPRSTLMFVKNTAPAAAQVYSASLVSTEETLESVFGVYYYFMTVDGVRQDISGNNEVRIKLEGITADSTVRILTVIDGEITELSHVFHDGYIVFESNGATEFAVIKTVSAYTKDTSALVIAIGVGAAVLVVVYVAFFTYGSQARKLRKRSIRKHKRWA